MTNSETAKSRVWFFPTSPRSPYKLKAELELLKSVSHLPWSRDKGQLKFAELLRQDPTYEGSASAADPTFPARDRTRGPKMLGLIDVTGSGSNSVLRLTEAGEKLLTLTDFEEQTLFLNQVAKVQFPSRQHKSRDFLAMNCRPLAITLEILLQVGSITKEEFGLFVISTTRPEQVTSSVESLKEFRRKISLAAPGLARKELRSQLVDEHISKIYAEDIAKGNTLLREGGTNFIKTKRQTVTGDYADSSFRYLLATGLFKIDRHGKTFSILESKRELSKSLVSELGLGSNYLNYQDDEYVDSYLGTLAEPSTTMFSLASQTAALEELLRENDTHQSENNALLAEFKTLKNGVDRELFYLSVEKEKREGIILERAVELVRNREASSIEITDFFDEITSRNSDLIDKPLFLEWNTWRAMTVLNDALQVTGNFRTDTDGNPIGTAAGRQPDILVEYSDFWLAVEVTLTSGAKQYEAESESITRHVGQLQANLIAEGDVRPIFGLFIAPKVNETVVNYLLVNSRMNSRAYKGPVKIVPLELERFKSLVDINKHLETTSSRKLKETLDQMFELPTAVTGDEQGWLEDTGSHLGELSLEPVS